MKRTIILVVVAVIMGIFAIRGCSRRANLSPAGVERGAPAPTTLKCKACGFSITLSAEEAGEYMKFIPAEITDDGPVLRCKECGKFGLVQVFPGDVEAE